MNRYKILALLTALWCNFALLANETTDPSEGILEGKIIDIKSEQPIEYANVAIFDLDGNLITGGITNIDGLFTIKNIKPGEYYLIAKFIGYEETRIDNLLITEDQRKFSMGSISLDPMTEELEGVEVVAERNAIQYKIDKKVVNPSQFLASSGGTAVDILANTPSITVDVEGNVTMRGSSNFTVLIDGKPTPFEGSDALEQVPASQIENIEIITNPSVKYDPDGTAGIINIITKRNRLQGVSGIVNLNANTIGSYGGDFLLNFQREKYDFFVGGSRSDRARKGQFYGLTQTFFNDTTYFNKQEGDGQRGFAFNNLKLGFNYHPNKKTTLTLNLNGGFNNRKFVNDVDYQVWNQFHGLVSDTLASRSENNNIGDGFFISGDLTFDKKFEKEGHNIIATFNYEISNGKEHNLTEERGTENFNGLQSWENSNSKELRFKADYMLPVNDFINIETGYQWRFDDEYEWYDLFEYNSPNPSYSPGSGSENYKTSDFLRHIHSVYGTIGGTWGNFGYKGGLRGEYTFREIDFSAVETPYTIDRFDIFPSIHFSYQLPFDIQLMASYSKRIERPRSYYLEPFDTWMNAYNVRRGNPNLQPEYIDSYEIGTQKTLKKGFVSLEAFYRSTDNRIERIQGVYIYPETGDTAKDIILMETANSGRDFALGVEGMVNYEINKWWSVNLNGQTFNYRIESSLNGENRTRESLNWGARLSNTFKPTSNTRLQLDVMYSSPTVTAQGSREGFAFTNIAVRQDFMKRKLSATLSVQDILNTAKFQMISEGPNFYSERRWDMISPVFELQLSYKINNFRAERPSRGEGGGGMDMDGGF